MRTLCTEWAMRLVLDGRRGRTVARQLLSIPLSWHTPTRWVSGVAVQRRQVGKGAQGSRGGSSTDCETDLVSARGTTAPRAPSTQPRGSGFLGGGSCYSW